MTIRAIEFDLELLFRALADRTRLRLINLMGDNEVCVCFFVEALKMSQPKISRHLAYLRRAGIVGVRREGKWMHYRLIAPKGKNAARMLEQLRAALAASKEMRRDRARLMGLCCSPRLPEALKRAPKPAAAEAR
ncbi:MAG TPA: metalloregulator ArsR/SmtB family transcription factor [Candidatus Binatia bacterium]|jgi:ArsR family transcriptional regulator